MTGEEGEEFMSIVILIVREEEEFINIAHGCGDRRGRGRVYKHSNTNSERRGRVYKDSA